MTCKLLRRGLIRRDSPSRASAGSPVRWFWGVRQIRRCTMAVSCKHRFCFMSNATKSPNKAGQDSIRLPIHVSIYLLIAVSSHLHMCFMTVSSYVHMYATYMVCHTYIWKIHIYVYTYTYMYVCVCIYTCAIVNMCKCIHMYACVYTECICSYICVYAHICMSLCMHMYIYVYMYIMYLYMYVSKRAFSCSFANSLSQSTARKI